VGNRKLLLIFLYLAGCTQLFAAEAIESNQPGVIREYYLNDKLKAEYSHKDGKLEGVCREYYESGPLASERNYKNGKRHGLSRIFYENGNLQFEAVYQDGKYLSGKEFSENGSPLEGLIKEYYPGGKPWSEAGYKGGKLDGTSKVYYEDGAIESEAVYKDGKLLSEKKYDEAGKLTSERNY